MNGRVYDPFTAQFFSPDPFIQAPDYWLNFNRYSYVLNNPFKYTDPSGELWHIVIGAVVGGTINWVANGFQFNMEGLSYFGAGFVAGGLTAAAPGAAFLVSGGLSATNSIIQQGFNENTTGIDWGQVAGAGIMGMATSVAGGAVGQMLGVNKWFSGVNSPILRSWLQNSTAGTITGTGFGLIGAGISGENVWQSMLQSGTMGFITGSISGIGDAAQFSLDNNVSMWSGKARANNPNNPVPNTVARVFSTEHIESNTLGVLTDDWVFVTDPRDIRGLNAADMSIRLGIDNPSPHGFVVYEFNTPSRIATPIRHPDVRFRGGGFTSGGAREFVIPNQQIPHGASFRIVF